MRPAEVVRTIKNMMKINRPLYLWGPPGLGKSAVVKQAAQEMDCSLIDVRAVLLDPVDLRGVPHIKTITATINGQERTYDQTQWCAPDFLPVKGKGILFLDELAQAMPAVQAALLQLTLDRCIANYSMPDEWYIVAASNRTQDKAGTHKLISPLKNRFIHVNMEVSHDDWLQWALDNGIHYMVRSFIQFKKGMLMSFDPSSNNNAFPSPRSWQFASDIMHHFPDTGERMEVLQGTVGEGAAAEFCGYIQNFGKLPDLDRLLADPKKSDIPKDDAIRYALVGALSDKILRAMKELSGVKRETIINNGFTVADLLPAEFSILLVRDMLSSNRSLVTHPKAKKWIESHRRLLCVK